MIRLESVNVVAQLIQAENATDATAADRLLSADFTAITRARGVEQNRHDLLHEIANPKKRSTRRSIEGQPWIRQTGDLAVARSIVAVVDESSAQPDRFRNTHVLVKESGDWKCIAWQVTKLA